VVNHLDIQKLYWVNSENISDWWFGIRRFQSCPNFEKNEGLHTLCDVNSTFEKLGWESKDNLMDYILEYKNKKSPKNRTFFIIKIKHI
jgi:hypothetical protein